MVDSTPKNKNDRTWCFWTREDNAWYNPAVNKTWNQFRFSAPGFDKIMDLSPFKYSFIRSEDFYTFCLNEISRDERFEFRTDEALEIISNKDEVVLKCRSEEYRGKLLFNSVFKLQHLKPSHVNYVQHFKGWVVETEQDCFDENCPVFMDFNTEQENDFRFYYLIPYSARKALIEYTGFSAQSLDDAEYDIKLQAYLQNHFKGMAFTLIEKENGLIPMAESDFVNPYGERVINIGTAGGNSKPSTGYTFYFIQKYVSSIILQLEKGHFPIVPFRRKKRFMYYDKILLDVLHQKQYEGRDVFIRLFRKNSIQTLLRFLNEETALYEELGVLNSVDKNLFLRSGLRKLFS